MESLEQLPNLAYIGELPTCLWVRFFKQVDDKPKVILDNRFHFKDYKSKNEALKAAKLFRDTAYILLLREGRINPYKLHLPNRPKMKNNKTGTVGVGFLDAIREKRGKNGYKYLFHEYGYFATGIEYVKEGNVIKRKAVKKWFSIKKWGVAGAYLLACKHRKKIEKRLNEPWHIELRQIYTETQEERRKEKQKDLAKVLYSELNKLCKISSSFTRPTSECYKLLKIIQSKYDIPYNTAQRLNKALECKTRNPFLCEIGKAMELLRINRR